MGSPVGRHQGVLDRVGGLLAVPQRPQRDCPEPIPMPPHDLSEGIGVAFHMPGEKIFVAHSVVSGVLRHLPLRSGCDVSL
ncbi:hypothetical protein ABB07_19135 [Streptomyces incarnatus]|uniref:Uncharacterized protein n=1 Tax=Streptomyces incarnatus TaxID=665007 RepID=A0ABM5TM03_9ACTN|nr:hypothetical protein ABB07_19135 [Streptomyces incarnatus]